MDLVKNNIVLGLCFVGCIGFSSTVISEEGAYSVTVELGIEYDDNITVSALNAVSGQSDEALVIDLSANYLAIQNEDQEVELAYDFYQTLHHNVEDFDLQIHTLSALGSWEINDLDVGLNYSFSKIYLGRNELYDSHGLTPSIAFTGLNNTYHRLSYSYLKKDFTSNNSGRDADQNSLGFDNYYFFMDSQAYTSFGVRIEDEDMKDPELDFQAAYLNLGLSMPISDSTDHPLKLQASYQHYWRDYENITASIANKRDDEQDLFSLSLSKPITDNFSAKFSYEHTNSDSNLASSDYNENVYMLSIVADIL